MSEPCTSPSESYLRTKRISLAEHVEYHVVHGMQMADLESQAPAA